jgi:hypothetical protein
MTDEDARMTGMPGGDLILRGLADLERRVESVEALLVAIGAPRLRRAGVAVPASAQLPASPEHGLYDLLCHQSPRGVHSRYNAWIRRLVSFERCLEFERMRARRRGENRFSP